MAHLKRYLNIGTAFLINCTNGDYQHKIITINKADTNRASPESVEEVKYEPREQRKNRSLDTNQTQDTLSEIEPACQSHSQKVCKNNIEWQWQDSCGTLEDKIQECSLGKECKDGECVCVVQCYAKFCGDNNCGGSCGECLKSENCLEATVCTPTCTSKKEWENTTFNEQIQWEWGCTITEFFGVRKIGEDYLATVIGDGNFCGGQFVVKINSKGDSMWIRHFYGNIIDVFGKEKGEYLVVVDQTLAIQDAKEIVYLTELCTINEKDLNTISCVAVDTNTKSKRKVNKALQEGLNILLMGTYENGIGSFAYMVEGEKKIAWSKTYNKDIKDEITSMAVHPSGYLLWGKKEGKNTLKLIGNNGDLIWEKEYASGFTGSQITIMDNEKYGIFGKSLSHYLLLNATGEVILNVALNIPNPKTKEYLLQTQVKLAELLPDGSYIAVGQNNPAFGSWVAHFGVNTELDQLTFEKYDEIQQIEETQQGYMALGTTWDGNKNVEWWMKRENGCGK